MLNPKFKFKPPHINRRNPKNNIYYYIYNYRFLLITLLLTSSNWLSALPLLSANAVTIINNQATGGYTNPSENNNQKEIESNNVKSENIILNSVSGTLYEDSDGGDDLDPNEPKLPADITINLLDSNDAVIETTTTQSDGTYIFTDVADGSYKIQVDINDSEIPTGYTLGTANDLPVTVSGNAVTEQNFGFDLQIGNCSIGGGTVDANVNPYISQEVTRNVIATRNLTDTLDDDWRAAATGGTSQGNIVKPWFGTTNAPGSISNFTYVDPATSATTNTTVELVEVPIADAAPCAGQTNNSSSNPILGTGNSLQASSPRPASLYDSSNQPAFWNQTNVPPSSTDNSRFAVPFYFRFTREILWCLVWRFRNPYREWNPRSFATVGCIGKSYW